MKRILTAVIIPLMLVMTAGDSAAQSVIKNSSLLYRIERPESPFRSYLFGTDHVVSSKLIDTSKIILGILDSVSMVVEECNDDNVDQEMLVKKMMMGPKDYYGYDSPEQEKQVMDYIKEKIPNGTLRTDVKPIVYIIMLGAYNTGYVTEKGVIENIDSYFIKVGKEMNKKLDYLETQEFQLSLLLDSISVKDQCKMLTSYVEYDGQTWNNVNDCYLAFDLDCVYERSFISYSEYGEMMTENRNLNWLNKIVNIINREPALIAVGALHLPGESGLINLLRMTGFTVTPVALR